MRFTLLLLFIYFPFSYNENNTEDDIIFLLYTRDNIDPEILRMDNTMNINSTSFHGYRESKILIHGYFDQVRETIYWMNICKELLHHGDYNVIIVDWLKVGTKFYSELIYDIDSIGKKIANLIQYLKDFGGAKFEDLHLIGHSLGAHIAGSVGNYISNLGRITGLDPAGSKFQNVPSHLHLDKSDANFVDVIHTDMAHDALVGFGTTEVIGHADFYPNGGNNQANCGIHNLFKLHSFETFIYALTCDHIRVLDYFLQSIRTCSFVGIKCADWKSFKRGECGDCKEKGNCAIMGHNADPKQIDLTAEQNIFYLTTSYYPPYCSYQYQVTLVLAHRKNSTIHISGMYLLLSGNDGKMFTPLVSGFATLRGANSYTYLLTSKENLGIINRLTFRWVDDTHNNERKKKKREKTRMRVKEIQVLPIQLGKEEIKHFCGTKRRSLRSNEDLILEAC